MAKAIATLKDRLRQGLQMVTEGKFVDAVKALQGVMHGLIFAIADTKDEQREIREMLGIAKEYVSALSFEFERKETTEPKRVVELAAYFTHFKLQTPHLILALNQGMKLAFKAKCMKTAGVLARRLLDLDPAEKPAEQARRIAQAADANPTDAIKLDYDDRNPFTLCVVSKKPMYRGTVDPIRCPFTGATAHPDYTGTLSPICGICTLGVDAVGLQNRTEA